MEALVQGRTSVALNRHQRLVMPRDISDGDEITALLVGHQRIVMALVNLYAKIAMALVYLCVNSRGSITAPYHSTYTFTGRSSGTPLAVLFMFGSGKPRPASTSSP